MCDQVYYYSDSCFQLELNLQSIRRNLIQALEDFEATDCRRCSLLKCRCETGQTPPRTPDNLPDTPGDDDGHKPPPATDVPRPDFKTSSESNSPTKDVESWVRASTPNAEKTDSPICKPMNIPWPPPKSVWDNYKQKINRPEINMATISQVGNVQDFFKSFNANYCIGSKYAHAQNRALMQKLQFVAKPQYSYF